MLDLIDCTTGLDVYNKLQSVWCYTVPPPAVCVDAQVSSRPAVWEDGQVNLRPAVWKDGQVNLRLAVWEDGQVNLRPAVWEDACGLDELHKFANVQIFLQLIPTHDALSP